MATRRFSSALLCVRSLVVLSLVLAAAALVAPRGAVLAAPPVGGPELPAARLAMPQLPFSPWGTVTIDGAPAPDGVAVTAWINGVQYGQTTTIGGYYSVDVMADDPDTPSVIEGGTAGQTVAFQVAGLSVAQTGSWLSGASPQINLIVAAGATPTATRTATATATLPAATATLTATPPAPTATETATATATATPTVSTPTTWRVILPIILSNR